jgi:hypothetical protein
VFYESVAPLELHGRVTSRSGGGRANSLR